MRIRLVKYNFTQGYVMKQNKIAIIYDFDGTLTPKSMQEYTLLPKLGINSKMFWNKIVKEARETGGETMMIYMRQLLDHAKKEILKYQKTNSSKWGKIFNIILVYLIGSKV